MKQPTRLLLLYAVLAVAGVVAVAVFADSPRVQPQGPDPDAIPGHRSVADPGSSMAGKDPCENPRIAEDPDRRTRLQPDPSGSDLPQGVKGVVADPQGYPLAGATVYLMPGLGANAFDLLEKKQKGMRFLPIAQATTGADGRFVLGLFWRDEDHHVELRIVHDDFCERSVPALQIQERDWYDAGTIRLKRGAAVRGRVTARVGGFPIAGARVTISNPSGVLQLAETPGQEDGLVALTEGDGRYRIPNVDPQKTCRISAVASGFARQERLHVTLAPEGETQVDFQLGPGFHIAGIVTGPTGEPIPYAKISAYLLSQKTMQTEETRANKHGNFEVLGLQQGSYTLVAESPGFVRGEEKPIPAGTNNVYVVLEKQGAVIVQAFGKHGLPLRDYEIRLRTWFEGSPLPGPTKVYRHAQGAPNGITTLEGLDPMDYVAEVRAKRHAKTFSAPFRIVASPRTTPRVTVRLSEGGVLAGIVLDDRNNPLPGVAIQTLPDHFVDNPLIRALGVEIPHRVTKTSVLTNELGEFRISLLNAGAYQLKFTHNGFCNLFTKGHEVQTGQTTNLGTIRLVRGALVDGFARLDGVARGQLKVAVTRVGDDKGNNLNPFGCEAVSNNSGHFVLPQRLPPGNYEARSYDPASMWSILNKPVRFRIDPGQTRHHLQLAIRAIGK